MTATDHRTCAMRRTLRSRLSARSVVAFVALLAALLVVAASASAAFAQNMAVPAYFYPNGSTLPLWSQMDTAAPTLKIAVVNPASGPGLTPDPYYQAAVRAAQQAGVTVVGYVPTAWGNTSIASIANVESEVNAYHTWYGVNGIFFDQASTSCSDATPSTSYYATLYSYVKNWGGTVILNPGTQTQSCYVQDADVLLTFEGTDSQYVNSYSAPSWVRNYSPGHFWHLIYDTSGVTAMTQAVRLSKQRNAGYVYVTPDTGSNPWDTLPSGSYWNDELQNISK